MEDVDKLSVKINLIGKDFRIEPYFEVHWGNMQYLYFIRSLYLQTFFEIARRKPELVRYLSRMIASIKHTHPRLIQSMILSVKHPTFDPNFIFSLDVRAISFLDEDEGTGPQNSSQSLFLFEWIHKIQTSPPNDRLQLLKKVFGGFHWDEHWHDLLLIGAKWAIPLPATRKPRSHEALSNPNYL